MEDMLAFTVRKARMKTLMTQEEMAEKLGISRKTYWKLEKDPGEMTVKQAVSFCRETGLDFDVFSFA